MSNIEWTDQTWNPIVGCKIVSKGCTNCYAMGMAARIQRMNKTNAETGYVNHYDGTTEKVNGKHVWTGKIARAPSKTLFAPLGRKTPTRYFVNSMGDLFADGVSDELVDNVFGVMALARHHTFQVLTKRPDRAKWYLRRVNTNGRHPSTDNAAIFAATGSWNTPLVDLTKWPLSNVWLGTSVEDQKTANARIPELLDSNAAVRFISAEPLLGPIDLKRIKPVIYTATANALTGVWQWDRGPTRRETEGLDWVIVGGESGPSARPMHPDWVRDLRDQCTGAGVAFFFKQWGEWVQASRDVCPDSSMETNGAFWLDWQGVKRKPSSYGLDKPIGVFRLGKKRAGRLLDGRVWDEMPSFIDPQNVGSGF